MAGFICRWPWAASLFVVMLLVLSACGGGGGGTPVTGAQYPESTLKGTLTAQQMSFLISQSGISFSLTPAYDVKYYKVAYETTTPSGATVVASGLLLVPQKAAGAASPLLSIQHGTIMTQSLAPSSVSLTTPASVPGDVWAGFAAASFGYVVAMPDYLGYGDSQSHFHPYVQAVPLATSAVDMLRASRQVLNDLGVATNSQLFLAGYSEGGYATLATQKLIETSLGSEFTITASEPGAGPYDLSGTVGAVMNSTNLAGVTRPGYLAFVVEAYHAYHDTSTARSDYYTTTALGCADTYFAGGNYGYNNNVSFDACVNSTVTTDILNASFLSAYVNSDPATAALRQAFADNDIYNWKPMVPTRLYYSQYDESVPAANTTTAHAAMTALGSATVEKVTCPITPTTNPQTSSFHGACSTPFFVDVIDNFNLYVTGL